GTTLSRGVTSCRPRAGKWNPKCASWSEGAAHRKQHAGSFAAILIRAGEAHVCKVLHRASGAGERDRPGDHVTRWSSSVSSSSIGVSAHHTSDGSGDHELSGREREDTRGNRRATDRAAGQRR